jgi:hypothetical protein
MKRPYFQLRTGDKGVSFRVLLADGFAYSFTTSFLPE